MIDAAFATFRARWSHPVLDRRDVEERIALRLVDAAPMEVRVLETPPACRVFVRKGDGWVSRYVHHVDDVDQALDALGGRA